MNFREEEEDKYSFIAIRVTLSNLNNLQELTQHSKATGQKIQNSIH